MTTRHQKTHGAASRTMRRANAQLVLDHMWWGGPATASELMAVTGLARATVLTLCRELRDQGWLASADAVRHAGEYTKGRPALRYEFRADAAYVVGVDAGQHGISASVADLRGHERGRAHRTMDPETETPQRRRREILEAIDSALAEADVEPSQVRSLVTGVPAPVDHEGMSPAGLNAFWGQMNPQLSTLGADRGWDCVVENDANLAALAELELAAAAQNESFAAILSGERFGAGIVLHGDLLRQPRGGAGEMGMLEMVSGVESVEGLGTWARRLAREALRGDDAGDSTLAKFSVEQVQAQHVFTAAREGDALARAISEKIADRLARICVVLAGLLDLDRIIVSGAVAPALEEVVASARQRVSEYLYAPWLRLEASSLGGEAVRVGAVRFAIDQVRARATEGRVSVGP